MIPVGAHLPSINPLEEAEERQADIAQIFLSNPQSWKKPPPRQDAAALRDSPIPIYVHAPYLINVCADNNRVRIPSRRILQDTCDAAAEVGDFDDELAQSGARKAFDDPHDERFAPGFQQRLRRAVRQRAHAIAAAGREDHGLQNGYAARGVRSWIASRTRKSG